MFAYFYSRQKNIMFDKNRTKVGLLDDKKCGSELQIAKRVKSFITRMT